MKRFAKSDYGNGDGREPVITQKSGGDMLLGTPIAGAVVGGRVYSRSQAIRLLGGGLAVAALLPDRLARTALAATVTSTYQAAVKKALSDQTDLIEDPEHCSADPDRLKTIGRAIGQQIRIKRSSSQYALYTVSEPRQESPDNVLRMGAVGRQRLGTSYEFAATVYAQVPNPTLTEAEAEVRSEFVERLADNGTHKGLIAIAPHGGRSSPTPTGRPSASPSGSRPRKLARGGARVGSRAGVPMSAGTSPRPTFTLRASRSWAGSSLGLRVCRRLPRVRRNGCPDRRARPSP
jgi:hypothetical protein